MLNKEDVKKKKAIKSIFLTKISMKINFLLKFEKLCQPFNINAEFFCFPFK